MLILSSVSVIINQTYQGITSLMHASLKCIQTKTTEASSFKSRHKRQFILNCQTINVLFHIHSVNFLE